MGYSRDIPMCYGETNSSADLATPITGRPEGIGSLLQNMVQRMVHIEEIWQRIDVNSHHLENDCGADDKTVRCPMCLVAIGSVNERSLRYRHIGNCWKAFCAFSAFKRCFNMVPWSSLLVTLQVVV